MPYALAGREQCLVALDWTEFDADDQCAILASPITAQGRSLPLVWRSLRQSELKGQRNFAEDAVLNRLHECLPAGVKVAIVAEAVAF